jgi:hypothetical protein
MIFKGFMRVNINFYLNFINNLAKFVWPKMEAEKYGCYKPWWLPKTTNKKASMMLASQSKNDG